MFASVNAAVNSAFPGVLRIGLQFAVAIVPLASLPASWPKFSSVGPTAA